MALFDLLYPLTGTCNCQQQWGLWNVCMGVYLEFTDLHGGGEKEVAGQNDSGLERSFRLAGMGSSLHHPDPVQRLTEGGEEQANE